MAFVAVARADELWSGEQLAVRAAGRRILIVNVDDCLSAFEDRCQHLGLPLSDGSLAGARLTCRHHGWSYDARSGAGLNPEHVCLARFPLVVREGLILVDPDPPDPPRGAHD